MFFSFGSVLFVVLILVVFDSETHAHTKESNSGGESSFQFLDFLMGKEFSDFIDASMKGTDVWEALKSVYEKYGGVISSATTVWSMIQIVSEFEKDKDVQEIVTDVSKILNALKQLRKLPATTFINGAAIAYVGWVTVEIFVSYVRIQNLRAEIDLIIKNTNAEIEENKKKLESLESDFSKIWNDFYSMISNEEEMTPEEVYSFLIRLPSMKARLQEIDEVLTSMESSMKSRRDELEEKQQILVDEDRGIDTNVIIGGVGTVVGIFLTAFAPPAGIAIATASVGLLGHQIINQQPAVSEDRRRVNKLISDCGEQIRNIEEVRSSVSDLIEELDQFFSQQKD